MALLLGDKFRSAIVDSGIVGKLGTSAVLKVFNGTQPGTAGGTAGTLLVTISPIAWNAASNGTAGITATVSGTAGSSGTASWARLSDSSGTSYIVDGACGTSVTSTFVIDAVNITALAEVTFSSATIVQPGS